jgi:thymidylate kinase
MLDPRWAVLRKVFAVFDAHGISHALPHGRENLQGKMGQDVDILVTRSASVSDLEGLLRNATGLNAKLVRRIDHTLVLLADDMMGGPHLIAIDVMRDLVIDGKILFGGEDVLATARKEDGISVASKDIELAWLLSRAVSRGKVSAARQNLIKDLIASSATTEVEKIWGKRTFETLLPGGTDHADGKITLQQFLTTLPSASRASIFSRAFRRLQNFINPPGFHIVMLGPDGAGKSSVVDTLEAKMEGAFSRVHILGFAPPLFRLWAKGPIDTSKPHSHKPRSYPFSLLRAGFWFAYQLVSHVTLRWMKSKNMLILNDRHFIDILVDRVRYRYNGPTWALQLVNWIAPKPDAFVLLSGPAEILQARKKEVSVEVTAQQLKAYGALVSKQKMGQIVDAAQPFDGVMCDVCDIIFRKK